MVTYWYDANNILVWSLCSRKCSELLETIKETHQCLELRRCKPNHQTLENESSTAFRHYLNKNDVAFQFVSPHTNRRNAAERAMRTFKTILFQSYVVFILISHRIYGVNSFHRQKWQHIWYAHAYRILNYQPTVPSKENSLTITPR